MKNALAILIAAIILFGIGFGTGYTIAKRSGTQTSITSEVILTTLKSQGFLVSQSYLFNQEVTIDRSTGSRIKDIFFGQDIDASANMQVSSGVDVSKLEEGDVDIKGDTILITLPDVQIFSVELVGPIEVENRQGVLKRLFDNDDGYNESVSLLKDEARKAASMDEIRVKARDAAEEEVSRLVSFIDPTKTVEIEFE